MAALIQNLPNAAIGRIIAHLGGLRLALARHQGADCLAVLGPGAPSLGAAHARAFSTLVPGRLAEGSDYVLLGCDAASTLAEGLQALPRNSVPYAQGIVLTQTIAQALAAAHRAGVTLGGISAHNIIVCRDGSLRIVGFGAPRSGWAQSACMAPSVASGREPTPASDVHSGLLFVRSLLPWSSSIPKLLDRILSGESGRSERALQAVLGKVLTLTGPSDGEAALRALKRYWIVTGVTPDAEGLFARLRSTLVRVRLRLGPQAEWFQLDDNPPVDLTRRQSARLVLTMLARSAPAACSLASLVEAGWPGETLLGSSGPDRLYVLISALRGFGLREVLTRTESGYALAAGVAVIWE